MTTKTTEIVQTEADNGMDVRVAAKVIESIVLRGDLSALGPAERARFYVQMCTSLGLNPSSQPFAFLRLNGKEILYATRGATDQLAAIHKLTREMVDGPKVIDVGGTKLVYAVCRAKHPNGRVETATATAPLVDPVNMLMKVETKAKRRVTLSILGLGLLDEMELETVPANVQEPAGGVDFEHLQGMSMPEEPTPPADEVEAPPAEVSPVLEHLNARIAEIELPGEAVAVWLKYRAELAPLSANDRETAWKALCRRTEEVGKMKNAKVWLKKAIAEEDARRGADTPLPNERVAPTRVVAGQRVQTTATTAANTTTAPAVAEPVIDTTAEVAVADDWRATPESMDAHVETLATYDAVMACARVEYATVGLAPLLKRRLMVVAGMGEEMANNEVVTAQRKAREAAQRGPHDDGPTSGGGAAGGSQGSATRATGNGSRATGGAHTAARAQLSAFVGHIAAKPRVRDPHDEKARTQSLSEIAMSYLKRREEFASAGIADAALDALRDELRGRGVVDTDAFLAGVIANLRRRTTTEHRAADRMAA